MIDLRDAALFIRLCETDNMTRAASLCNVSPSTLSRTLSKLEHSLGTVLCIRNKKGITITNDGRRFEEFARNTLVEYAELKNDLATNGEHLSGEASIYCSVTACYIFIPRIINELKLVAPKLEIKLETGDPADALSKLEDTNTDFVISALPNEVPSYISFVDLVSFPLILIAPKQTNFMHSYREAISANRFNQVPFIMPEHGQLLFETERWFKSQNIEPNVYSRVAGHEAIVSLTALGFGLAVVPRLVYDISPFKADVVVLKDLPNANFRVALCYLKSRSKELMLRTVLSVARRLAPSFQPELHRRRNDQY